MIGQVEHTMTAVGTLLPRLGLGTVESTAVAPSLARASRILSATASPSRAPLASDSGAALRVR